MKQYLMITESLTTFDKLYFYLDATDDDDANRQAIEIVQASDYMAKDYSLYKEI